MYSREMIYLTLYQENRRIGNAGYVKVDIRDGDAAFQFLCRNLPQTIRGEYPVQVKADGIWRESGSVAVRDGQGSLRCKEKELQSVEKLQILMENGYRAEGTGRAFQTEADTAQSKEQRIMPKETERTNVETVADRAPKEQRVVPEETERTSAETVPNRAPKEQRVVPKETERASAETVADRAPKEQRIVPEEMERAGAETVPDCAPKEQRIVPIKRIREDKWEQLLEMYDKIHPYGDERIYLRLEPKDFVILQEKYQHLVNNSFLLHGFYNYRYVILGKEKGDVYYLGVPGVFYEKEKMVALMFGFEAFDCEGGEADPGGFGYYLRRVEL